MDELQHLRACGGLPLPAVGSVWQSVWGGGFPEKEKISWEKLRSMSTGRLYDHLVG